MMIRNKLGPTGGLISVTSFIEPNERKAVADRMSRLASVAVREAAKEGLQSLYADPEEVLKDNADLADKMRELRGGKFLWVKARAIDADIVNANGDYFSEEELLKDYEDQQGNKMPAYKTFEGVPIYTNHENNDVVKSKGAVVTAEWDDKEKCVWCTFYIDEESYPDIARGVRVGYIHDVSMGCQVQSGKCSECGNIAVTEKDYCECLKKSKGKSRNGRKIYEENFDLKFIELSLVGDGAFDSCEIVAIYDSEDILEKAMELDRKAEGIRAQVAIASAYRHSDPEHKQAYEECLRMVLANTTTVVRLAQSAGTLVGGPLMASDGANNNTTIGTILQALGLDPKAGLNVMDMLNLSLNFMEVGVMNLFARKDNVNLAHVGKITKAMADLQSCMQDMIDDGVDSMGGGQAPLNQNQLQGGQGGQGGQMTPGPNQAQGDYGAAGNVGRAIGPQNPQTQGNAFIVPSGFGGGLLNLASSSGKKLVWSHDRDEEIRTVTASTKTAGHTSNRMEKLENFGQKLCDFSSALGLSAPSQVIRAADNNNQKKTAANTKAVGGNDTMDIFKAFAAQHQKRTAAAVTVNYEVEDGENKLVLSTKGDVLAYHRGTRVAWTPTITSTHYEAIESGKGNDVAVDLLSEFSRTVESAKKNGRMVEADWKPNNEHEEVREVQLEKLRTGKPGNEVQEELLDSKADRYKHKHEEQEIKERELESADYYSKRGKEELGGGDHDKVRENLLSEDAGLYERRNDNSDGDVKEKLLADARLGNPDEVIELQLETARGDYGPGTPNLTVKAALTALAKAVIAARVTPDEVVEVAAKLAAREDISDIIRLAQLGAARRQKIVTRLAYHGKPIPVLDTESAVAAALGEAVNSDIRSANIAKALRSASQNIGNTVKSVNRLAKEMLGDSGVEPAAIRRVVSEDDLYRAAFAAQAEDDNLVGREHAKAVLCAMADSAYELRALPKEVIASLNDSSLEGLIAEIEVARSESATKSRHAQRERDHYYGFTRTAGVSDIHSNAVGWLADYCIANKFPTASIAEATVRVVDLPKIAERGVSRIIKSAIEVRDEESKTKTLICRTEDLGGLDTGSDDFKEQFRQRALEIFASHGWAADPATFSLNEINVSSSGDITASVTSRFSRSIQVDGASQAQSVDAGVPGAPGTVTSAGETPIEGQLPHEEEATVITAAAKKYRIARRKALIRQAQMGGAPMGGGGAGAMGGGMGGDPMGGAAGADPAGGISAFTGENPEGAPPEDTDSMPNPGEPVEPGTRCPRCGSENTDFAAGQGKCNDCGINYSVKTLIEIEDSGDDDKSKKGGEEAPMGEEDPLGAMAEGGLGGATAPQPGGAPGAPGAAPAANPGGMMMQASYLEDPDTWVRFAQGDINRNTRVASLDTKNPGRMAGAPLPPGMCCPHCGNRHASQVRNSTFCHKCGTIAKTRQPKASAEHPYMLEIKTEWIV